MTNLTHSEYWKEISSIAETLVDEAMDEAKQDYDGNNPDFDELKEIAEESINDSRLHETIDGHQWVIYYAYNLDVIQHSANEDYYSDNFGAESLASSLEQGGLDALHCHIAFYAMYADVQDNIDNAFDEYESNMDEAA
jgi:hypothetical protein